MDTPEDAALYGLAGVLVLMAIWGILGLLGGSLPNAPPVLAAVKALSALLIIAFAGGLVLMARR